MSEKKIMSTKPTSLPVQFENIPLELKQIPRWVMWKFLEVGDEETKRWSKVPFQPTGIHASATNPKTWSDFVTVQDTYTKDPNHFDGVGFVLTGDDNLIGVDLDDCYDDYNNGFTDAALQQLYESVEGYAEVSPSGTGVKIITRADIQHAHVDHSIGLEVYPKGRYFTITGHVVGGERRAIPSQSLDFSGILPERTITRSGDDFADYKKPLDDWDIHRVETELLTKLSPDDHYMDWLKVGAIMHHQFDGDVEALEAWDRWSQGSAKYSARGKNSCESKWGTFGGSGATLASLIFLVNQREEKAALDRGEVILDDGVMNHASVFLDAEYRDEEGYQIVHYADEFYQYVKTHYEVIETDTIRSKLYMFLNKCKKPARKGELKPFNPSPASVSGAVDAIKALTHLPNHVNTKPPIWLPKYAYNNPDASKLISLRNGIFHLEDRILSPHSLGFFTQNSLPFDYDPKAECPTWMKFLHEVWPDDQESIDCLQEIMGYILSGDTKQQKFFNFIGPRRSGKGTINKVLVSLLGQHNTVAPELGELCDTFGLQPWLGKLLASFTDARAPERNRGAVVSQLLRIVGGDTITVNRKNKESWNGYLPTRIVIYSNEVLQLTENSNALTGRMIVLRMTKSFYNKEDTELSHKLSQELSGIFNWAIQGLIRRVERGGHFVQPESGKDLLELMSDIGNPIGSFTEDAIIFDSASSVSKDAVFACFKQWAIRKSLPYGTEQAFKRRFLAATQEHGITSQKDRTNGKSTNVYQGIKLTEKAQKYIDDNVVFDEGPF